MSCLRPGFGARSVCPPEELLRGPGQEVGSFCGGRRFRLTGGRAAVKCGAVSKTWRPSTWVAKGKVRGIKEELFGLAPQACTGKMGRWQYKNVTTKMCRRGSLGSQGWCVLSEARHSLLEARTTYVKAKQTLRDAIKGRCRTLVTCEKNESANVKLRRLPGGLE